jgi:hypothetical protein
VVGCFLYAMGTTGSRHGQATSIGYIVMTESGITQWTAFVLMLEAREASFSMQCMTSTSKTILPSSE